MDGEEIEASGVPPEGWRRFALMFYNLPEEGVEVEPRPPEFMPPFLDFRDPTVVSKSFVFSGEERAGQADREAPRVEPMADESKPV